MTSILKKNKELNFITAFVTSTLMYVLFFYTINELDIDLEIIRSAIILTFSGFVSTLILSYQDSFSLKFALNQTILILIFQYFLLLLVFFNLYTIILLFYAIPIGILFVSLGAFVGYVLCKEAKIS